MLLIVAKVSVVFPGQAGCIRFTPAASGKTDIWVSRDDAVLAKADKPVVPLADADSDALTTSLRTIPARLAALLQQSYDPLKLPGFLADWDFNQVVDGAFPPLPAIRQLEGYGLSG